MTFIMPNPNPKRLLLASPRGFCAGVKRAIQALNNALKAYPDQTVYCYHQIVHNTHVVSDFESKGVKFVNSVEEVPSGSVLIFSSHGVSPEIRRGARNLQLITIDATCPFVTKTHLEVKKYAAEGAKILYIGQVGHDEAAGTIGEAPEAAVIIQAIEDVDKLTFSPDDNIALVTQTTLSFDETEQLRQELKRRFPLLIEPAKIDICMATQNRQAGVKELVKQGAEVVIVLGSPGSSNSNKLRKVAEKAGAKAMLLDDISEIDPEFLKGINIVGLTGGASLPEKKITKAIEWLKSQGVSEIEDVAVADKSEVALPSVPIIP